MTQLQCRSYASLEFDGCPACIDAALDATQQAALYVLGRAALDQPARGGGSIEMAYTMSVRILDEQGRTIAQDQIDAEQTIGAVEADDETDDAADEPEEAYSTLERFSRMRLEDFQTVLDQLELMPMGSGMCGRIGGRLYGFERSIGRFEVDVAPGR